MVQLILPLHFFVLIWTWHNDRMYGEVCDQSDACAAIYQSVSAGDAPRQMALVANEKLENNFRMLTI